MAYLRNQSFIGLCMERRSEIKSPDWCSTRNKTKQHKVRKKMSSTKERIGTFVSRFSLLPCLMHWISTFRESSTTSTNSCTPRNTHSTSAGIDEQSILGDPHLSVHLALSVPLSLSLSAYRYEQKDFDGLLITGRKNAPKRPTLSLTHLLIHPPTYPCVYTLNLHQGNVNDNQWGYCNPPSRLFPLPSTFLPTSPSGRYLPNLTYLSALTCLVVVPTNPLTIKRTMLEEIKWGYWKKICFLKGMIKIFANTFHGDIACNHLSWGYCI